MGALTLLQEYHANKEEFFYHLDFAHGELYQAEVESQLKWPGIAELIRNQRKLLEDDDDYCIDFSELLGYVRPIIEQVRREEDDGDTE